MNGGSFSVASRRQFLILALRTEILSTSRSLGYVYFNDLAYPAYTPLWKDIYWNRAFEAAHHIHSPRAGQRLSQKDRNVHIEQTCRSSPDPTCYFYYRRVNQQDKTKSSSVQQDPEAGGENGNNNAHAGNRERNTALGRDRSDGFLTFLERAASVYDKF